MRGREVTLNRSFNEKNKIPLESISDDAVNLPVENKSPLPKIERGL
jgi:hypothetical protein